jgi:hypothetical protein
MTFVLALAAAVLGAASLVLHVVAPKTKNTLDDKISKAVDDALAKIKG